MLADQRRADRGIESENRGGIDSSEGVITLNNSTISGNHATLDGGGIDQWGATVNVNNCTISGNTAANDGGGVCSDGTGSINVSV